VGQGRSWGRAWGCTAVVAVEVVVAQVLSCRRDASLASCGAQRRL